MLCMAKEWVVIEHMFVEVPCLILLLVYTNYKFGPRIAEFLDKKSEVSYDKYRFLKHLFLKPSV